MKSTKRKSGSGSKRSTSSSARAQRGIVGDEKGVQNVGMQNDDNSNIDDQSNKRDSGFSNGTGYSTGVSSSEEMATNEQPPAEGGDIDSNDLASDESSQDRE